jgi:hypothetical protein
MADDDTRSPFETPGAKPETTPNSLVGYVRRGVEQAQTAPETPETLSPPQPTPEQTPENPEKFNRLLDVTQKVLEAIGARPLLTDADLEEIKNKVSSTEPLEYQNALPNSLFRHPVFILTKVCEKFLAENPNAVPEEDLVKYAILELYVDKNKIPEEYQAALNYFEYLLRALRLDKNQIHQLYFGGKFEELVETSLASYAEEDKDNGYQLFFDAFPELGLNHSGEIVVRELDTDLFPPEHRPDPAA